jgi:hypothetical protein
MSFRFSLAAVLRIRLSLEEREEGILVRIIQEIALNAQRLEALDAQAADIVRGRQEKLATAARGTAVHQSYGEIEELKLARKEIEDRQRKLAQLRNEQMEIYAAAHRNRRMLTELYEERRAIYDANLARLEQLAIDDNFGARRNRR